MVSDSGWTMVSDHGWPWSGNVLTMVEPWLTMVMLNGHHCQPWLTMVKQPWLTMVSSTFKSQMTMVTHGQIPDVQTFIINTPGRWTLLNHGQWPWLTMVWQCFDHGWTMVDHGQVKSGNHGLTMANHGQFHIHWKSNDHGQSWSNTWCLGIPINTPGDEHGWTMVSDHGWPWSGNVWPWLNHGWPWSGNHDQSLSVPHF